MAYQKLHYENMGGLLIRRDGLLHWRCPDCKAEGESQNVLRFCPQCKHQTRKTHHDKPMAEEHADELMVAHMDGMRAGQPAGAQQPCPTCIALARTVMLDQVSFDRKPDCYGIRQITDDDGVEAWEDIRSSPDVAREEANDMMATGRGEIYEVVPLWTAPQPTQAQAGAVPLTKEQRRRIVLTADTVSEAIDMVERHHGIKGGQHGTE